MKFASPLLFITLFFSTLLSGQIIIGFNGGYAAARDLNHEIYIYNQINKSGLKKEMNLVHWNYGPALGIRSKGSLFGEFLYSWKGLKVSSQFDSSGVPMIRELKVHQHTFNYGFGVKSDDWVLGMSMDFGRFRGKGRKGPEASIESIPFHSLWVDKSPFGLLSLIIPVHYTVFAEYKYKIFGLRFYYQLAPIRIDLTELDPWLFGTYLNYGEYMHDSFTNFGMMVSIQIGDN